MALIARRTWIFIFVATLLAAIAPQTHSFDEVGLSDPDVAVRSGIEMESRRDWRDAIQHYKGALKKWPENEALTRGLRRSQFQFSVTRRYGDSTFVQTLKPMSRDAAMALFDEVLVNVQTYYVEPINTTSIVAHGTESLWLALGNEKFLDENLFGADKKGVEDLRLQLFQRYWNKPIQSRMGARQVIGEICDLCYSKVGLENGPVIMEYVFAATNCLDDYSNVLTPGKRQDLFGNIKGEFVGIGIVMEAEDGEGMNLIQVLPESPAQEAGLKRGDRIVGVNAQDCRWMTTEEAASLLAGKSGSRVDLEVTRKGQTFSASCIRREVQVKSIPVARIIDSERGIGYIQMTGFQQSTVQELDAALFKLKSQGMQYLIWDLRENPGGLLTASIEVLDRFISNGVIVSTKGRMSDQNMTYRATSPGTWDIPIALLVDENSASASEIVAGAMKDHDRAVVVGRKTFGKWSVQSIYDSRYNTGIRLTTAKFYSPKGGTWGKIGLEPDILVQQGPENRPLGDVDLEHDPDLREAMRQVTQRQFTQR